MSHAHRRLLRQTNAVALSFRRAGRSWSRARICACDCERRAAGLFGERVWVLPSRCIQKGYSGPLRGVRKVRLW